jgi:DNA modification methylase
MNIKDIKPNPDNPRVIRDEKFQKLKKSIEEFPKMMALRPIVVDDNGMILGGNMRLKALQDLGYKEVPDEWVKEASELSEEEKQRFIIADNVGFGDWDWDDLKANWDVNQIAEWGLDIPEFEEDVAIEAKEDDYDIPDVIHTDIVLGDLFEIGEHRLLCGDSTDSDQVAKLMNNNKAEILFTSPPYSDMREYNGEKDLSISNLIEFITSYYQYCEYQIINLGIQRKDNDINEYWNDYITKARDNGYKFLSWNVWHKSGVSIGQQSAFIPIYHEWIFVFGKKFKNINRTWERKTEIQNNKTTKRRQVDGSTKKSTLGKQESMKEMESVFYSISEVGKIRSLHPATFPVELPSEYIKAMTNNNDIIAEPFCGSGTTMVSAHQLNRKCYGMELDPKYCQVIIDRMLKLDPSIEVKRNGQKYIPNPVKNS